MNVSAFSLKDSVLHPPFLPLRLPRARQVFKGLGQINLCAKLTRLKRLFQETWIPFKNP
jgi:hypothetical protein